MIFFLNNLGCSQAVRQRVLIPCTVGSNPTTPAIYKIIHNGLKFFVVDFVAKNIGVVVGNVLQPVNTFRSKKPLYGGNTTSAL